MSDYSKETTPLVSNTAAGGGMATWQAAVVLGKGFVGVGWMSVALGIKEVRDLDVILTQSHATAPRRCLSSSLPPYCRRTCWAVCLARWSSQVSQQAACSASLKFMPSMWVAARMRISQHAGHTPPDNNSG